MTWYSPCLNFSHLWGVTELYISHKCLVVRTKWTFFVGSNQQDRLKHLQAKFPVAVRMNCTNNVCGVKDRQLSSLYSNEGPKYVHTRFLSCIIHRLSSYCIVVQVNKPSEGASIRSVSRKVLVSLWGSFSYISRARSVIIWVLNTHLVVVLHAHIQCVLSTTEVHFFIRIVIHFGVNIVVFTIS